MNTQNATEFTSNAEKFQSAEQLWFWFLYSKSVRNGFAQNRNVTTRRVCEILDVETLITQYIWAENRAAALWRSAMDVIDSAAKQMGWID